MTGQLRTHETQTQIHHENDDIDIDIAILFSEVSMTLHIQFNSIQFYCKIGMTERSQ